jgi:SAM-dependent methyltransferase
MANSLVRVGPVHFQPLEQELEPVLPFLRGHLLNAGSGARDIRQFLTDRGVTHLTLYDIASSDPEVILGPLEKTPFGDSTFDAVLCNAVLEHVVDAEAAIGELARVVRPGGHVVVAVPFLQPFHPCPGDFRRYTADGLASLGRDAGLELVLILPVHTIAQTIGWILWEYALEKGGRWRRYAAGLIAYAATRLWNRTDTQVVKNANTFQAVFRRPERVDGAFTGAWREHPLPLASANVPTMLVPDELRLLNYLTGEFFVGAGAIVDAGSFLGGSTVALADGLRRNLRRRSLPETKVIHSYDRFQVEQYTLGTFFPETTEIGTSFEAQFRRNIAPFEALVRVNPGDVLSHEWTGGPIEILFIDIAKNWRVCDWVTYQFFRHLIPGRSIVVQQDYLYHHFVGWLHVTMEHYAEYFEYLCDTEVNSVAFRYVKKIPDEVLRVDTVGSLTTAEKTTLMDRAAYRFQGAQREMLLLAKAHFLELLESESSAPVREA